MCGDADLSTLGRRLGYLRRLAGLEMGQDVSRKQVAKALGVSQTIVGRWETDEKGPSRDRVPKIAAAYGVAAGWILTGEGQPPATARLKLKPEKKQRSLGDAFDAHRRKKEG